MSQIFILFFFYFTVLFSILGYGKLVTLFNSNNQDNEFDGINGIAFLIVLSYITNFFTSHNYLHNSIIILFGLLIFISKNLNRINHEYIKYNYNLIKNPFFYLNKDSFKINDMVKIYYEKQKENSKKKYLILNKKILN